VKYSKIIKQNFTIALLALIFGMAKPTQAHADAATDYRDFCSVCHGDSGNASTQAKTALDPPPQDFTTTGFKDTLTRKIMVDFVTNGKPGTAMMAWKTRLSEDRIAAIVDHIRQNFMTGFEGASKLEERHPAKRLYDETCAVCHGVDGSGEDWGRKAFNRPPADFLSERSLEVLNPERIRFSITNGHPGTAMAAYSGRLSEEQVSSLADFIWSVLMHHGKEDVADNKSDAIKAEPTDQSAPMPEGLSGDPLAGAAGYTRNCVACHGSTGGGDGPRAYYIDPRPRNFNTPAAMNTFNRPGLYYGIKFGVNGRIMPAWGTVLSDQEIADIAEFVFQEFIRSGGSTP